MYERSMGSHARQPTCHTEVAQRRWQKLWLEETQVRAQCKWECEGTDNCLDYVDLEKAKERMRKQKIQELPFHCLFLSPNKAHDVYILQFC